MTETVPCDVCLSAPAKHMMNPGGTRYCSHCYPIALGAPSGANFNAWIDTERRRTVSTLLEKLSGLVEVFDSRASHNHCEACGEHAVNGPIPHRDDCAIETARAVVARARGDS
jgi:hypothetical protein